MMATLQDDEFDDDILQHIASYAEAADLLSLALSCKRFQSEALRPTENIEK